MMFWNDSHLVLWQAGLTWIGMIILWALLLCGVFTLTVGATRGSDGGNHQVDDARRILDRRPARGEIDTEDYRRLRDLIADHDRTSIGTGGRK